MRITVKFSFIILRQRGDGYILVPCPTLLLFAFLTVCASNIAIVIGPIASTGVTHLWVAPLPQIRRLHKVFFLITVNADIDDNGSFLSRSLFFCNKSCVFSTIINQNISSFSHSLPNLCTTMTNCDCRPMIQPLLMTDNRTWPIMTIFQQVAIIFFEELHDSLWCIHGKQSISSFLCNFLAYRMEPIHIFSEQSLLRPDLSYLGAEAIALKSHSIMVECIHVFLLSFLCCFFSLRRLLEWMPTSVAARSCYARTLWLAGSSPTRITVNEGAPNSCESCWTFVF